MLMEDMEEEVLRSEPVEEREFCFTLPITSFVERSFGENDPTNEYGLPPGDYMFIEGWASDTSEDKLKGQMTERAVIGMVNCVNHGTYAPVFNSVERARTAPKAPTVGVDVDHSPSWPDQIGYAVEARAIYDIPEEMRRAMPDAKPPIMWVKEAIDLDMSHGRDLRRAMRKNTKLGMSVFGRVVEGTRKVSRSGQVLSERFDVVDLKRIAITSAPVNNVTWVREVARSMTGANMMEEVVELDSSMQEAVETAEVVETEASEAVTAPAEAPQAAPDAADPAPAEAVEDAAQEQAPEAEQGTAEAEAPETAESAEAPAEAPIALERQADVARALDLMQEVFVGSEVFRSFQTQMVDLMNEVPTLIERAQNDTAARFEELLKERDAKIAALTEQVDTFLKSGPGRQGTVARSFTEEYTGDGGENPVKGIDPDVRRSLQQKFTDIGRPELAVALMMGWADDEVIAALKTGDSVGGPLEDKAPVHQ